MCNRLVHISQSVMAIGLLAVFFLASGLNASHASELDDRAAALATRATELDAAKKRQITKYETAISDYNAATNLEPLFPTLEAAFRKDLMEKYNSDRFDDAKFTAYFTPDYLTNFNAQLKRRQNAMAAYNKILLDADTTLRESGKKLAQEIDDTNIELVKAGKAKIGAPADTTTTNANLDALRAQMTQLPERLVTLEDVRARIGIKGVRTASAPPVQQVAPSVQPAPIVPATPIPVAPAITGVDAFGVWVRGDGKVTWRFDNGGVMTVRLNDKKATHGAWVFDDKTGTLTVTHEGASQSFKLFREQGRMFMEGGAGPGATVRFNKSLRAPQ